jgi:WD40 repeat protein
MDESYGLPDTDHLPYPAALMVDRLRQSIASGESSWDRISRFKEAVEATVKGFCLYGLGAYFEFPGRTAARDEVLLGDLARPATGQWIKMLGDLCKILCDAPQPCSGLYRLFFRRTKNGHEEAETYKSLKDFTEFRNDLHHTARRPAAEYESDLHAWLPRFATIIAGSAFLVDYPLIRPIENKSAELWRGANLGKVVTGAFPAAALLHFGYVAEGREFIDVDPFAMLLVCDGCDTERIFFYDSQKSYGSTDAKKQAFMLEYEAGHRSARREPIGPLERRFTPELMVRAYNAFRAKIVSVERYLRDFSMLLAQHSDIVGRRFVRDRIARFLEDRKMGVFLLTGEPGIGKTALLASLIDEEIGRIHFFYRHASGLRNPDDFVECVLNSLCNKYRLEPELKATDPRQRRAQLENLLPLVAARLRPGDKEVIIVDALDEAGTASDGTTAVQALPQLLPEGIYLILSSRSDIPQLRLLDERSDIERFEIRAGSTENRDDAYVFVDQLLGVRCTTEVRRSLADRTEWNFLTLKLLCEALLHEEITLDGLDKFFSSGGRLWNWYETYWERLGVQFAQRPELLGRVNQILGAIAAAGSPVSAEQVCESLRLPLSDFQWSLRFIGQYFDTIRASETGINREGAHEVVLYRLFHAGFREFVLTRLHSDMTPFHKRWAVLLREWDDFEGLEREEALRDLPGHLSKARMHDELVVLLTDLTFVRAKCSAGMTYNLVADYNAALSGADPARATPALAEFAGFVVRRAHRLAERPALVFPLAINEPDGSAPAQAAERGLAAGHETAPYLRLVNKSNVREPRRLTLAGHSGNVTSSGLSPDGRYAAAGCTDGTISLWDAATGRRELTLGRHGGPVTTFAFSADATELATGSADGTVKLWDLADGSERLAMTHGAPVQACALSADGRWIVTVAADRSIVRWDAATGEARSRRFGRVPWSKKAVLIWLASLSLPLLFLPVLLMEIYGYQSIRPSTDSQGRLVAQYVTLHPHVPWWFKPLIFFYIVGRLSDFPKRAGRASGLSTDGQLAAWALDDGRVTVWQTLTGTELATWGGTGRPAVACAFTADGTRVACATDRRRPLVWDLATGRTLASRRRTSDTATDLSGYAAAGLNHPFPNGVGDRWLLPDLSEGLLQLWDGRPPEPAPRPVSRLRALLGWFTDDKNADAEAPTPVRRPVLWCGFSPGARWIVATRRRLGGWRPQPELEITVCDSGTAEPRRALPPHGRVVQAFAFSPDGRSVVADTGRGHVTRWDLSTGDESRDRFRIAPVSGCWRPLFRDFMVLTAALTAVGLAPFVLLMTLALAAGDTEGFGMLLKVTAAVIPAMATLTCALILIPAYFINLYLPPGGGSFAVAPGERSFASIPSSGYYLLRLWDTSTWTCRSVYGGLRHGPGALAFSPDGSRIASVSGSPRLRLSFGSKARGVVSNIAIWDVDRAFEIGRLVGPSVSALGCAFSPDGRLVAGAVTSKALETHYRRPAWRRPKGTSHEPESLVLWDVETRAPRTSLTGHNAPITGWSFSPDGTRVATSDGNGIVMTWEVAGGTKLATIRAHSAAVHTVTFSPNATLFATCSNDLSVRIWNAEDATPVAEFVSPRPPTCLGWHPASTSLVVGDVDGQIMKLELNNLPGAPAVVTAWRDPGASSLRFECPHCLDWSKPGEEAVGGQTACGGCGTSVRIARSSEWGGSPPYDDHRR